MKNETSSSVSAVVSALGTLRRPPIVLCIGSDRVTGDCIGPLVGYMLSRKEVNATVLGTLSSPVTALNVAEVVRSLSEMHPGRKIIAVDSCVGEEGELGKIRVSRGPLRPGLACGKSLPKVGDVSITATVAAGSVDSLYSVRLGFVFSLASEITEAVAAALSVCEKSKRARKNYDHVNTI